MTKLFILKTSEKGLEVFTDLGQAISKGNEQA